MKNVFYFTADWCQPCKKVKPIVEDMKKEGFQFQRIDADYEQLLVKQFQVKSIPTFILLENGKEASIDKSGDRQRFTSNILGNQQINRVMAIAFKLHSYELLEDKNNLNNYEVAFKDNNKDNLCIENLIIIQKKENELRKGQCHFSNERVISKKEINEDEIKQKYELKNIVEYPRYNFYSNGMIFESGRYRIGANRSDNYISGTFINNLNTQETRKHHRLICMAFHPIEGKTKYDDYNDLQVNHKDGNPQNNAADNLEWCTQSENQLHKNQSITKGNQQVNMYDGNTEELLKEFVSISEAARFLYDEEYGKFVATDNEEELEKYRKKCNCC
jgi:thiol-disulfide isomerase/thioredoxin